MSRIVKRETKKITRTAQDWIDNILNTVDPSPTVADLVDINVAGSFVTSVLVETTPVGNVSECLEYDITKLDIIDDLIDEDVAGLVPKDIESIQYDSVAGTVVITLASIETEVGS